jgi:hypothetical protein
MMAVKGEDVLSPTVDTFLVHRLSVAHYSQYYRTEYFGVDDTVHKWAQTTRSTYNRT